MTDPTPVDTVAKGANDAFLSAYIRDSGKS